MFQSRANRLIGKAAVIGASGYVGRYLLDRLGARGIGTYTARRAPGLVRFDIARDCLQALQQDATELTHLFLVGGAANPERCAREPAETRAINVDGSVRLLEEAMRAGVMPVFLSTDYVFAGDRGGYREEDATAPTTNYGRQKAEVEAWLQQSGHSFLLTRLSKVVGVESDIHSIIGQWCAEIKAGKPIKAAIDQVFSPASAGDIAHALVDLCDAGQSGIWHVAGPEPVSRFQLAEILAGEIRKVAPSTPIDLSTCNLNDVGFAEVRPLKTWLNVDKLANFLPWRFKPMQELCHEAARLHFG
jgi:dTDP-4-dehydrorhamnose reductase